MTNSKDSREKPESYDIEILNCVSFDSVSDKIEIMRIYQTRLFFILLLVLLPLAAFAKEIRFETALQRNVIALGQSVQLSLTFDGIRDVPKPELPDMEGLQAKYIGPSTRMSIVNGKISSSITHIYSLIPLKTGKFAIGPFSIEHEGNTFTSNPLRIEVVERPEQAGAAPGDSQDESAELGDRVFLQMRTDKSRAYMNEAITLTIKLYVSSFSLRDIQYPEFGHDGFSAEEFGKPKQYREQRVGRMYDVVEFSGRVFGTRPGAFNLGPAQLKANLMIKTQRRGRASPFDDFFGRGMFDDFFEGYQTSPIELQSDELPLNILPFPEEGKPADFSGAVGDFALEVGISPDEIKQGDPVTVSMVVSGEGNFSTVTSPVLKGGDGFKVYEPQMKQQGNRKIFEQIIIPLDDAIREIPAVTFSYFDPGKERYQILSKSHIPITVIKREKDEEITLVEAPRTVERISPKEELGRDIVYIKESQGRLKEKGDYLYKEPLFLMIQIVPLILFISVMMIQRKRERLRTDTVYARRLLAPRRAKKGMRTAEGYLKDNKPEEFYASVYKTLQEYIGDRYHLPPGGITSDIVETGLRERDMDDKILYTLKSIFRECDVARYASSGLVISDMEKTVKDLRAVIDYMERHSK